MAFGENPISGAGVYLQSPAAFHSHFAITSLFCFLRGGEYKAFPKSHALRDQLTWTHYRLLMKVENEKARQFYLEECVKSDWSTR